MNTTEPLGLPRGSVRAILALGIVGSTIIFAGAAQITGHQADASMIGLAGSIVGFYFGTRNGEAPLSPAEEPLPKPALGDEDDS